MSDNLNRRDFFKKSLIASATVTSALSLEEKNLLAQMNKPAPKTAVGLGICPADSPLWDCGAKKREQGQDHHDGDSHPGRCKKAEDVFKDLQTHHLIPTGAFLRGSPGRRLES